MTPHALFIAAVVLATGCTHPKQTETAPSTSFGKYAAPVTIDAALSESNAKLTLTFEAAGKDVSVTVAGLDGLTIADSQPLLTDATVNAKDSRRFDVGMTRGPGQGNLVVTVRGRFGASSLSRVVTFAVGEGALPAGPGTPLVTDDGQRLKVMPAPSPKN